MSDKVSKSNGEWELIEARLDEVGLSSYERIKAKAQLARAEAVADALAALSATVKRAVKQVFERPYHHPNTSIR
jgi:hypothetical protein